MDTSLPTVDLKIYQLTIWSFSNFISRQEFDVVHDLPKTEKKHSTLDQNKSNLFFKLSKLTEINMIRIKNLKTLLKIKC